MAATKISRAVSFNLRFLVVFILSICVSGAIGDPRLRIAKRQLNETSTTTVMPATLPTTSFSDSGTTGTVGGNSVESSTTTSSTPTENPPQPTTTTSTTLNIAVDATTTISTTLDILVGATTTTTLPQTETISAAGSEINPLMVWPVCQANGTCGSACMTNSQRCCNNSTGKTCTLPQTCCGTTCCKANQLCQNGACVRNPNYNGTAVTAAAQAGSACGWGAQSCAGYCISSSLACCDSYGGTWCSYSTQRCCGSGTSCCEQGVCVLDSDCSAGSSCYSCADVGKPNLCGPDWTTACYGSGSSGSSSGSCLTAGCASGQICYDCSWSGEAPGTRGYKCGWDWTNACS
ncbi:hypothetical protein M427DRAFT_342469 [Gonapodya prolifera JEL478]|uniref:Uncharacterized protein n=1 Tax=Gonapodya prolifera (strain JEL478) TaxID=1344416 RepID=A0A139AVB9_GONPJ|nr:hypothetical protein M427DRAFT_342469 [Gonapodya prolifera JEL478]|eukprot:KXS20681.1 hypothetical protein M427DRAFT_342469 [Gonapodya prolifera JEL478]